jgi:hypothetical protein
MVKLAPPHIVALPAGLVVMLAGQVVAILTPDPSLPAERGEVEE